MKWISIWAQQIIVAVIVATIIEMILPKGNNKKYIKTVIGVYILFTIILPVLANSFSENLQVNLSEYEKYFEESETYTELSKNFENSNNENIENTYVISLKQDIKEKLKNKAYSANKIHLEVELEDEQRYGEIKNMEIEIRKIQQTKEENKNNTVNEIGINKISIGNKTENKENTSNEKNLNETEKKELLQYLSEEYGVEQKNITII